MLGDVLGHSQRTLSLLEDVRALLHPKRSTAATEEDAFQSLPVAELDLSKQRTNGRSYRQLPAGFPMQACSERSRWEQSLLNDIWVSVPTGSEDFSFKHMRRNVYEEALFRCEDERYEVDQIVANNHSTIRALEPLESEIRALAAADGYEWQVRLDRRSLSTIHLRSIARVYGTKASVMLELLRKHPAGAIPVILQRLKQKDLEWRKARQQLNRHWKAVMERNYHKSLDHRSFYFKQRDKKATMAKSLVAEMRAAVEKAEAMAKSA